MEFLEKDLEDIIINCEQKKLRERGLHCLVYAGIFRQVNFGDYGIADIITVLFKNARSVVVTVYELKQQTINVATLLQAVGYQKAIEHFVGEHYSFCGSIEYKICLIGRKIDTSGNFVFLADFIPNLTLVSYSYSWDGIWFTTHNNYKIIKAKFPESTMDRLGISVKKMLRTSVQVTAKEVQLEVDEFPF